MAPSNLRCILRNLTYDLHQHLPVTDNLFTEMSHLAKKQLYKPCKHAQVRVLPVRSFQVVPAKSVLLTSMGFINRAVHTSNYIDIKTKLTIQYYCNDSLPKGTA